MAESIDQLQDLIALVEMSTPNGRLIKRKAVLLEVLKNKLKENKEATERLKKNEAVTEAMKQLGVDETAKLNHGDVIFVEHRCPKCPDIHMAALIVWSVEGTILKVARDLQVDKEDNVKIGGWFPLKKSDIKSLKVLT